MAVLDPPPPHSIATRPMSLLVVDDEPALREGLLQLFAASSLPLLALFAAGSRADALLIVRQHAPEVIVLDIDLAGDDGLALLPALHGHERVLVLSSQDDAATRHRALTLGAAGFASKREPGRVLLQQLSELVLRT